MKKDIPETVEELSPTESAGKIRLSKAMSKAGIASRRACEKLIFEGQVAVNGQVLLLPQTLVSSEDQITINGRPMGGAEELYYFILNKPKGYICSTKTHSKRTRLVLDLFQEEGVRLFTVGRLDKDTEGLLLVTNDGHFANRVIHPSSNLSKEYVAKVDVEITADHLKAISAGTLVDGVYVKPQKVEKVRRGTVKIVVKEGRKHEVRLLLTEAGLGVKQLSRIRIGSLKLNTLPVGTYRPLTPRERELIFA